MHELSIAQAIIDIAERHAAGRRVVRVEVQVGRLRQVVPGALEFAFELAAAGTAVEGAELVMEDVPVVARCRACATEADVPGLPLECPRCGGLDLEVLRGEELLVDSLELEETLSSIGGTHGD